MAEEHEFQAPEGHKLCANNCGFFGSLTTSDLCSKCHRDLRMKAEQNAIAKAAFDDNSTSKSTRSSPSPTPLTASASASSSIVIPALRLPESAAAAAERADLKSVSGVDVQVQLPIANRCVACKRRVGLTGFKCRCESTFCGAHRYPEKHGCTFDYKAMGKAAIAKANPVVKAAKLHKI